MKEIQLSQGKFAQVDDDDFYYLLQWRWSFLKSDSGPGYAVRTTRATEGKKTILMHRFLMNTPKGMECDHIDGNGLNNQRSNLRNCAPYWNKINVRKYSGSTSIYKGVWYDKATKSWQVSISGNYIGRFKSEIHAAMAYDIWAKDLFGEYPKLNFKKIRGSF